jgi:hypothetical protein
MGTNNYSEWLNGLKIGDTVIVTSNTIGIPDRVLIVGSMTDKQVIVDGTRFWKKNGSGVGGGDWHRQHLRYPEPEEIARIRERNFRSSVYRRLRNLLDHQHECDKIAGEVWEKVAGDLGLFKPQVQSPDAIKSVG